MKNQKGFSLVELLVVVIIIAIIAAIAIPSLLASRRAANEASAVQSMRTYHSAQSTFQALDVNRLYATTPAALTNLVDNVLNGTVLTAGAIVKSGYTLNLNTNTGATAYCAGAVPVTPGATGTGNNHYGVASANGGVVVADATLAMTCATGALTGGTQVPVQ